MQGQPDPSGGLGPPEYQPSEGRTRSQWNPRVVAGVVCIGLLTSVIFIFLTMTSVLPRDVTGGGVHAVSMLVRIGLIFFFTAMVSGVVYAVVRQFRRAPTIVKPWTFDMAVFKRYQDSLEALCMGAGVDMPQLFVKNMPTPLAYIEYQYAQQAFGFTVNASRQQIVGHDLCVTNALLSQDFTRQEVEAIAAVLLGKEELDRAVQAAPIKFYDRKVSELSLSEHLVGVVRREFLDDRICLFQLLADAYAARLTGHPEAIASAIRKSDSLVKMNPIRPRGVEPRMMFVEPKAEGAFSNFGSLFVNAPFRSTGDKRDRIIQLRLESLGVIDQGMRQPFSEIHDGRPVTGPEGWE